MGFGVLQGVVQFAAQEGRLVLRVGRFDAPAKSGKLLPPATPHGPDQGGILVAGEILKRGRLTPFLPHE